MNNNRNDEHLPPVVSLADIYFVVFRHKWKIIVLTLIGLVAAAYYYHTKQPPFQSDAELLIRYVQDARSVNPTANSSQTTSMMDGDNIMRSEVKIITSFDLAATVATNVGPEKILAKMGGGNNANSAAGVINGNLKAEPNGNMIRITFSSQDPTIVQPVLTAVVAAYKDKSDQIHQAVDMSFEDVAVNTERLKQQLSDNDRQLRQAKKDAGVIDVTASQKSYADEIERLRSEISEAQIGLAEHEATLTNALFASARPVASTNQTVGPAAPPEQLAKYTSAVKLLNALQRKEDDYLSAGYMTGNKLVKEVQAQIDDATKTKTELETNYPALTKVDVTTPDSTGGAAAANGMNTFSSLPIRIAMLQSRLTQVQASADQLDTAETKIADLERQQKILESSYDNLANTLQASQIRNSLGSGKNANIQEITSPTQFYKDYKKFYRTVSFLMVGGLLAGLAWAFAIEYLFDRSIKRPVEIQNKLKIPFFLSIPDLNHNRRSRFIGAGNRRQLAYKNGTSETGVTVPAKDGSLEVMAWEINRRFDSYYDALRDRLVVYFESINLTRKPKLVAVTSTHKGAGVSTIAAGLASSLSETGDGRVLLVDMNQEHGSAQQYFRGRANCKLDDALESEKRDGAMVQENLYVVTEDIFTDKLPRALPKRFASLIPKLKASDYDYIIFDMPPVSPTSVTSRLAGFMDTVMLVIESEKTDQQVVQQANALLAQSKANVTAVLNKTKHYIPARLHKDFLSDI